MQEFTLPLQHQDIIRQQAADKHLDPALIAAVIYAETKFDPRTSAAGAEGLMQILPQTAEFLARKSGATTFTTADLGTPQVNIAYGSYYLRYLLDEYGGKLVPAIAAYNGGEANVSRWLAEARARGRRFTIGTSRFPRRARTWRGSSRHGRTIATRTRPNSGTADAIVVQVGPASALLGDPADADSTRARFV